MMMNETSDTVAVVTSENGQQWVYESVNDAEIDEGDMCEVMHVSDAPWADKHPIGVIWSDDAAFMLTEWDDSHRSYDE